MNRSRFLKALLALPFAPSLITEAGRRRPHLMDILPGGKHGFPKTAMIVDFQRSYPEIVKHWHMMAHQHAKNLNRQILERLS